MSHAEIAARLEAAIGADQAAPGDEVAGAVIMLSKGMLAQLGVILGTLTAETALQIIVDTKRKYDITLSPSDVAELFALYWNCDDASRGVQTNEEDLRHATGLFMEGIVGYMREKLAKLDAEIAACSTAANS